MTYLNAIEEGIFHNFDILSFEMIILEMRFVHLATVQLTKGWTLHTYR